MGNILADGHKASSPSATATFVRFENRIFVVTCLHVKQIAFKGRGSTARLHAGRAVIELAHWTTKGVRVPSLRDVDRDTAIDVSLCELPVYLLELLSRDKVKRPIDLDNFTAPDWPIIRYCLAAGFPDRAKSEDGAILTSPMVEAVAELASKVDSASTSFVLQSKLKTAPKWTFSGMSGGPIFALGANTPQPVGIIFEGYPSGEEANRPSDAFLCERDILIRGQMLTPDIFRSWLHAVELI
ncbi:MAG TPA: hypothetical protein VF485_14825 [Sphingomonas sp.]